MPDINGIPYVESDDLVSAYPAVSQSLAQEVSDQLASKLEPPTWQTWSPTYQNLTGGSTDTARYLQIGKLVFCAWQYTLAGLDVSGGVTITLPFTSANMPLTHIGWSLYTETGVDNHAGLVQLQSTTRAILKRQINLTDRIRPRDLSASEPFTWGAGDVMKAYFSYERA